MQKKLKTKFQLLGCFESAVMKQQMPTHDKVGGCMDRQRQLWATGGCVRMGLIMEDLSEKLGWRKSKTEIG